jgi:hypothetical protein
MSEQEAYNRFRDFWRNRAGEDDEAYARMRDETPFGETSAQLIEQDATGPLGSVP